MTLALPVLGEGSLRPERQTPRYPIAERGQFIKQFSGPDPSSGIVCFKFWQLVAASGCPFKCAYCFLQSTAFFRFNKPALMGQVYSNWRQMIEEVEEWLKSPTPRMLIVGECRMGSYSIALTRRSAASR